MKLSDSAYVKFKHHLFTGDLRPGQFISQRELVKLTGIPLGPVRETLQRLEVEGLVHIVPQRGIQIVEASLRFIRDTYQLRMLIEKEAAAKFAENASDAQIEALEAKHKDIIARFEQEGPSDALLQEAQGVDWNLHDTIVEALGNSIVNNLHKLNNDRIKLIRLAHGNLTLITPGTFLQAMKEHMAVIEALKKHDASASVAAIERHLTTALHRALGL
ncbi:MULTISPECIES: GntR family transcriptional regulator [Cohaesibacter]|uniref:GntR family transcriptional regulator n=1 Tax=Cohaesibacter TaxID=655352 RepID=UPI000DEB509E|nr:MULTISPECIES: GntR family transcriptional regulator [Cohaesibacter]TLP42343.1 GntR family transcriptional regulator [Cohaesibacter sp. CAU 1516]